MQLFFKRPVAILLFIALALVLVGRGIVPALFKVDTDFPNYFTAAKIVADSGDTDRLYDNLWFQEQMGRYQIGKASEGAFKPFPPPTALLLVPFTRFEPHNALRIMTGVSVLCPTICSIALLAKIFSWSFVDSGAFVLLSGYAVLNALRLGQPYILVSLSCILGYYAHLKRRPLLAGTCFGLFTPIDSLFRRLFIFDATLNPRPLWALPPLYGIGLIITKVSILLAAIATLVKLARSGAANTNAMSIGILGIFTLLVAPATATYHFILLWLPVGLVMNCFFRESAPLYAYFVLGAYSLIGFFPYGHAYRFEGRGGLTVLAYPRLFLLLAIFMACVYFIWNRTEPNWEARTHESPLFLDGNPLHDPG